jgi:hypothetical protein
MPLAKCPRCSCEYDPCVIYSVQELADMYHVAKKTVLGWMVLGRLEYRVRPINGKRNIKIVDGTQLLKFLDTYWPNPKLDPGADSLAHRQWRKARQTAKIGVDAAQAARRARAIQRRASTPTK